MSGKQSAGIVKLDDDPCAAFRQASLKCLEQNRYDKERCVAAFDEYKACRQKELDTRRQRRIEERQRKGKGP